MQQDIDSLVPARRFSRRGFVHASVGSGFAAAVLPIAAQTVVKTDSGAVVRLIAGSLGDVGGPVRDVVPEPQYMDVSLSAGTEFVHPVIVKRPSLPEV